MSAAPPDPEERADGILPPIASATPRRRDADAPQRAALQDPAPIIEMLMRDPALRYTDSGRTLLRWLNSRRISVAECAELVESVPPHCTGTVATYARRVAESWAQFANQLEEREQATA